MAGDGGKKQGFTVIDRRFWARDDDDENDADNILSRQKPTYLMTLEQKLEEKEKRIQDLAQRHRQLEDDAENGKLRMRREIGKEMERNRRSVILEFLEILDNLDRAIDSFKKGDQASEPFFEGVVLVRNQFLAKLQALSVMPISVAQENFDPRFHEAMTVVPVEEKELDGQVVGIIREGYMIGEEVLRPAGVAVARMNI